MTPDKLMECRSQQVRWGTSRGKVEIRVLLLHAPQETTHPQSTRASAACECCSPETAPLPKTQPPLATVTAEQCQGEEYCICGTNCSCLNTSSVLSWRTGRLSVTDKHSWLSQARQHFQKSQKFAMNFAWLPGCHTCLSEILHYCQYTTGYTVVNICVC